MFKFWFLVILVFFFIAEASNFSLIRSKQNFLTTIFCKKYSCIRDKTSIYEVYKPKINVFLSISRHADFTITSMGITLIPDNLLKSFDIRNNAEKLNDLISDFTEIAIGIPFFKLKVAQSCFDVFTSEAFKTKNFIDRTKGGRGRQFRFKVATGMVRMLCWETPGLVDGYSLSIEAVKALPSEK